MNLYAVFHLNLLFSSIETEQRAAVVEKCYWPILGLAKSGLPVAVELTGLTAELIADIDREWCRELSRLVESGQAELVGSGYSQLIGPLVPAMVNRENQRMGIDVYRDLFGVTPRVAMINELACSRSIPAFYLDAGYQAILVEWNNARRFTSWPESLQYEVCATPAGADRAIDVIWADSISFQQLQRRVHGQIGEREHEQFLRSHFGGAPGANGAYKSLYCGDAEVFGFRPGRFSAEADLRGDEWARLRQAFEQAAAIGRLVLPSTILAESSGERPAVEIGTAEQPVVVKKQRKYNVNRWALSGRDDLRINSRCHFWAAQHNVDARKLCRLWSSDYRTHITDARWKEFSAEFDTAGPEVAPGGEWPESDGRVSRDDGILQMENDAVALELDEKTGFSMRSFRARGNEPLIGLVPHGVFADIEFAADFYSGHVVVHRPGRRLGSSIDKPLEASVHVENGEACAEQRFEWGTLATRWRLAGRSLVMKRTLRFPAREIAAIRVASFTFLPEAWNPAGLGYRTHNGGEELESFALNDREVDHTASVSMFNSSEFGVGMTGGVFEWFDDGNRVRFEVSVNGDFVLPKVIHRRVSGGRMFSRVEFSAQEVDETLVARDAPFEIHFALRVTLLPSAGA